MNPILCSLVMEYHHINRRRLTPLSIGKLTSERIGEILSPDVELLHRVGEEEILEVRGREALTERLRAPLLSSTVNSILKGSLSQKEEGVIQLKVDLIATETCGARTIRRVLQEISVFEFCTDENGAYAISKIRTTLRSH